MYSHEIEQLLRVKNYLLNDKEYFNIVKTSPQINYSEYNPFENAIKMSTKDGYNFKFKVKSNKNNFSK